MSPQHGSWKFRGMSCKQSRPAAEHGQDRLFPASLTPFLSLPATQAGSQTHPGSGKCCGVFSVPSFRAVSDWWGSGTLAATEAGHVLKFQFHHTLGHKAVRQ